MRSKLAAALILAAWPALAQEALTERQARGLLFNERRADLILRPHASMSPAEAEAFQLVADQLTAQVPYYGAIAVSPDQGLNSPATVARGNYHSAEAAAAAVLADCNRLRASGTAPCAVVAEVLPRRWEPRALQLSAGATAQFRADYARARGERAMAISPSSGGYGIGKGAGAQAAALAACEAAAGSIGDCRVVIAD